MNKICSTFQLFSPYRFREKKRFRLLDRRTDKNWKLNNCTYAGRMLELNDLEMNSFAKGGMITFEWILALDISAPYLLLYYCYV